MSDLRVKAGVSSGSVKGKHVEETELLSILHEKIQDKAFAYVVLDYAVALGYYQDGQISIKLNTGEELLDLPTAYLQELRVFQNDREFRAVRNGESFDWRLRIDDGSISGSENLYVLDETHKLWGSVQSEADQCEWSRLRTQRGSSIYFPEEIPLHGEKGLRVRNYIRLHDVEIQTGRNDIRESADTRNDTVDIVEYVDERFCCFVDWPVQQEGGVEDAGE